MVLRLNANPSYFTPFRLLIFTEYVCLFSFQHSYNNKIVKILIFQLYESFSKVSWTEDNIVFYPKSLI